MKKLNFLRLYLLLKELFNQLINKERKWKMNINFRDQEGNSKMILIDTNIINVFQKDQKQMDPFCKKVKESSGIVFIAYQVLSEIAGLKCKKEESSIERLEIIKEMMEKIQLKFLPDNRFFIKKEIDGDGIIESIPVYSDYVMNIFLKDLKRSRESLIELDNKINPKFSSKDILDIFGVSPEEKKENIDKLYSKTKKQREKNDEIYKDFKENGYNHLKAKYFHFHFVYLEWIIYKKLIQLTLIENKEDDLLNTNLTIEEMEKLLKTTMTQKKLSDISKKVQYIKKEIGGQDKEFHGLSQQKIDALKEQFDRDIRKEFKYPFLKTYASIRYYNDLKQEHIDKVSHGSFIHSKENQRNDDLFLPLCVYSKAFITEDGPLKDKGDEIKTIIELPIQKLKDFMKSKP